ncbi:MAG: fatty acid desaturase [Synechococcus sp. ChSW.bin.154]
MVAESVQQRNLGLVFAAIITAIWLISLVSCLSLDLESLQLSTLAPLVLLRTFAQTGLFIIGHDAMHGNLSPKRSKLNSFIGAASLILYAGINYHRCKSNHILHHLKAETERDPDYLSHPDHSALRWFWDFLRQYMSLGPLMILVSCWATLTTLIPSAGQQAVLSVAIFCALPLILSALQLFFVGTWFPHHLNKNNPHHQTPRSLTIHPLLSFAACYHFGYHREHHLSPSTPWFDLPRLRQRSPLSQTA